jgi:hypothetical protein
MCPLGHTWQPSLCATLQKDSSVQYECDMFTSSSSQTSPQPTTAICTASLGVQTVNLAVQIDGVDQHALLASTKEVERRTLATQTDTAIDQELGDEDRNSGVMLVNRMLVDAETQMDGDSDALHSFLPAQSVDKETPTENDKDSRLTNPGFRKLRRVFNLVVTERMTDTYGRRFRPPSMSALWCYIPLAVVVLAIAIAYRSLTSGFISIPGGPSYYDRAAWAPTIRFSWEVRVLLPMEAKVLLLI